ncbi:MAG: MFS transporter [Fibrobacteres bacterium]|nr:MFS transporter [Fibrobacterota bacterium]
MAWLKASEVPPESVNEHGQITDEKILNRNRIKFGIGTVLYQSEESGIGPIPTAIIRALGGTQFHLGIYGAVGGIGNMFQWVGTLLLTKFKSNQKAMIVSMILGLITAVCITAVLLLGTSPHFKSTALWLYLPLVLIFYSIGGVQWNIESSWIGDLVPKNRLGWFTSIKWVIGVFGIMVFAYAFARLGDWRPTLKTFSLVYLVFAVSFVVAAILYMTSTDRVPKSANFLTQGATKHERLNYKAVPLWTYILFYVFWSGGRTTMFTFTFAYMMDTFGYSMSKMAVIGIVQFVVSMIMLTIMGKFTDHSGHRKPLIIVSGIVAFCMLLWVASAWWGIVALIAYAVVNGAAGHTHSMLAINYSLEIFPDKGRSAYLALSRFFIGGAAVTFTILGGKALDAFKGFHIQLWGATLNQYHALFIVCSIFTLCCIFPLIYIGKRTVDSLWD